MSNTTILDRAARLDVEKMPGHWLLGSLGKRVLRPGGMELTRQLVAQLRVTPQDDVIEFAPGLGATARLVLAQQPRSYIGIEREPMVERRLAARFTGLNTRFRCASAESTGLPSCSATVLYCEAMISMQTPEQKTRILAEAFRLLQPGGRFGVHELALVPDDIGDADRKAIERELSLNIHVGVRPATAVEWRSLLRDAGFQLQWQVNGQMRLLEPKRIIRDEGVGGALRVGFNLLRRPAARRRVAAMRGVFHRYAVHLGAVTMVCTKSAAA
ncbi:MAG: class I SAM-dependent methyltransferase [Terriglobales bacterium]